jgi:hypothetical protein
MAYDYTKFSCANAGGVGGVYTYQTADPKAAVLAAGYFNPVQGTLNVNNRIHAWTGIGTGSVDYVDIAVASVAPGAVATLSLPSYL